jgi:hypothetical protein
MDQEIVLFDVWSFMPVNYLEKEVIVRINYLTVNQLHPLRGLR